MGKLLQKFEHFDLWKIERQDLAEFTKFVLRVNYEHHLQTVAPIEEIEACCKEDEYSYEDKHFYALKTKDGQIFGTIKAWLWNGKDKLAMEEEYGLDIKQIIKARGLNPPQIWYTGRIAIDRKLINQSPELRALKVFYFKLLLTCFFAHVCTHPENVTVSSIDKKMHKAFIKLGIVCEELGEGHFTMGSEALPVINTGAGLQPFFEKHKHLLNYV